MIQQILKENEIFKNNVNYFKNKSPYFPEIIKEIKNNGENDIFYASTMVRIFRNEKWYKIHCLESAIMGYSVTQQDVIKKLMTMAYINHYLYMINERFPQLQELDQLQITEEERLRVLITPKKK